MAPKKTSKISNTPQSKKTRGRQKKIQSPSSIKIEIPVQQSLAGPTPRAKRTRKSNISFERKIELANEVVRTQLVRKVQIKHELDVTQNKAEPKVFNLTAAIENNVKATRKRAADSTQQPVKYRKVTVKNTPKPKSAKKQTGASKENVQKKKILQGKKKIKDAVTDVQNLNIPMDNVEPITELTAAAIDSRTTSMTSASNFSWTKDISSSSTTTCVTVSSNDFVRIDKKLPVLELINVDSEIHKYKKLESDDSTSESDSTSSDTSSQVDLLDLHSGSLNLSTSSPSAFNDNQNCTSKTDSIKGDVTKALIKLSSMLKNFDSEIMNWIGYGDNSTKKYNDKILQVLKEESQVIAHCRKLKHILSDKGRDEVDNTDAQFNAVVANDLSVSFDDDYPIAKDNVLLNENVEYPHSPKSPSITYDSDYALDNFNYASFDRNNDDDDALSLFAESITGIEPSRTNDSCDSPGPPEVKNEEYVPRVVNNTSCSSEKYEYHPTKITVPDGTVKKNICEKQNADSTSIYRENGSGENLCQDVEECASEPPLSSEVNLEDGEITNTEELPNQIGPPPATSIFQQLPRKMTTIFKGICFYNLINACKRIGRCTYPHLVPSLMELKSRLMRLSEGKFIEEYIFVSSWPMLRRKFGIYFVEECNRRGMTRILVEMAIDFVLNVKPKCKEDSDYQVAVLEYILLGLNDVGLFVCEDLLNYQLEGNIHLCDVLMRVIAFSQNFSRFKQVFLNLTNVMVQHQRTFSSDVAQQILERVCILPAEESLLRAVFDITKNTDSCIFSNSMMSLFETRLSTVSSEWREEFVTFKREKVGPSLNVCTSPVKGKDLEPLKINCTNKEGKERYTSPDTTKVDTMQNKASEPTITRTVNFKRTCSFNSTPNKNNIEDWLNNKFHNWRQKPQNQPSTPLWTTSPVRPMRPRKDHPVTNYRTPTSKYHPRPPRYF